MLICLSVLSLVLCMFKTLGHFLDVFFSYMKKIKLQWRTLLEDCDSHQQRWPQRSPLSDINTLGCSLLTAYNAYWFVSPIVIVCWPLILFLFLYALEKKCILLLLECSINSINFNWFVVLFHSSVSLPILCLINSICYQEGSVEVFYCICFCIFLLFVSFLYFKASTNTFKNFFWSFWWLNSLIVMKSLSLSLVIFFALQMILRYQ